MKVVVLFELVKSNGHKTSKFEPFDFDFYSIEDLNSEVEERKSAILKSNPVTIEEVNAIGFQIV